MSVSFRHRLKSLRKEKNVTQAQIAAILDYGYTAVANYEAGKNEPSIENLIRIADFFGVSLDYLVGRSEVKNELESQEQITKFLERYDHITLAEVIRLLECQRGWTRAFTAITRNIYWSKVKPINMNELSALSEKLDISKCNHFGKKMKKVSTKDIAVLCL